MTANKETANSSRLIETIGEVRTKFANRIRVEVKRNKSTRPAHVEAVYIMEDSPKALVLRIMTRVQWPILYHAGSLGVGKEACLFYKFKGRSNARNCSDEVLIFGVEGQLTYHEHIDVTWYGVSIALVRVSPTEPLILWKEENDHANAE